LNSIVAGKAVFIPSESSCLGEAAARCLAGKGARVAYALEQHPNVSFNAALLRPQVQEY
jgi:hypothetical protein